MLLSHSEEKLSCSDDLWVLFVEGISWREDKQGGEGRQNHRMILVGKAL